MNRWSIKKIVHFFFSGDLSWVVALIIVGILHDGCSEFVIKEGDDGSAIIGKTMYRTVFAIGTLGYSETKMSELTEKYEREQKLKAFEARVMEFLENGEITQAEANRLIQNEKARLWNDEEGVTQDRQTP